MKKLLIRWAIKQIKILSKNKSYQELNKYGIVDIIKHEKTKESMYIF